MPPQNPTAKQWFTSVGDFNVGLSPKFVISHNEVVLIVSGDEINETNELRGIERDMRTIELPDITGL